MQWQQRMYKKMWCTCKVVVLLGQAITFLTFSLSLQSWHLKLPIINFTIPCDQSQTKFSRCKLKFSRWYHLKRLSDSLVVPLFLVRKVGNESSSCTQNVGERNGQIWWDKSCRVRTNEKNSGDAVPIWHNNTKHFLCPIRSQHLLDHLEMVWWESVPKGSSARTWIQRNLY